MNIGELRFSVKFANVVKASVAKMRQILETSSIYNTTEIDNIVRFKLSASFRKNFNV